MFPYFMNSVNFYKMSQGYKNQGFWRISKKEHESMTIDISVVEIFNEEWNMLFRR